MRGNEHLSPMDAQAERDRSAPSLLAPQVIARPAPAAILAVIAIGFATGAAFLWLGDVDDRRWHGHDSTASGNDRDRIFSVSADQTAGALKILPANFQNAPSSVLAQLQLPEAEKARLSIKLADGSVRLAAVTLWDTQAEDGDTVDLSAASFTQRLVILHKPKTFFLAVQPGGSVLIKGVLDGGGGITLGVSTILGPYPLPSLVVGQSVEIPAL